MTRTAARTLALSLTLAAVAGPAAAAGMPTGTFRTEDGRARIRIEPCGAKGDRLCGYVVWLKEASLADGTPKLDAYNPDAKLRSRPALGIQLLHGLAADADQRYAGQIYNADNGKRYDVTVWSESPTQMSLRGCLVAFLCKTQTWERVADLAPGQLAGLTGAPNGPRPDAGYGKAPTTVAKASPRKAPAPAPAGATVAAPPSAAAPADE